jgi:predicted DNA-binding transcriptional regulator AlpA
MTTNRDGDLLKPAYVGEWLGMTEDSLAQLRYRGTGPRFVKLTARATRYRRSDVELWIEQQSRTQTGEQ